MSCAYQARWPGTPGQRNASQALHGCPGRSNHNIVHAYFTYGAHNIENFYLFGPYLVANNQTDQAKAALCTGFNHTGCGTFYSAPHSGVADMTPSTPLS